MVVSMKVGDLICLSSQAVCVYGFSSDKGLITGRVQQKKYSANAGYPDDWHIMINGKIVIVGFEIERDCEVISEDR